MYKKENMIINRRSGNRGSQLKIYNVSLTN